MVLVPATIVAQLLHRGPAIVRCLREVEPVNPGCPAAQAACESCGIRQLTPTPAGWAKRRLLRPAGSPARPADAAAPRGVENCHVSWRCITLR